MRKHNTGPAQPDPPADRARSRTGSSIRNFVYSQGDLSYPGKAGLPPAVRQGQSLTFVNEDTPLTERFHTITACKAPCNLTGGIGYPLANGAGGSTPASSATARRSARGSTARRRRGRRADHGGRRHAAPTRPSAPTVPGLVGVIANGCVGTAVYKTPKNLTPGHLHVLLPDPPVHARRVPRRQEEREGVSAAQSEPAMRAAYSPRATRRTARRWPAGSCAGSIPKRRSAQSPRTSGPGLRQ